MKSSLGLGSRFSFRTYLKESEYQTKNSKLEEIKKKSPKSPKKLKINYVISPIRATLKEKPKFELYSPYKNIRNQKLDFKLMKLKSHESFEEPLSKLSKIYISEDEKERNLAEDLKNMKRI